MRIARPLALSCAVSLVPSLASAQCDVTIVESQSTNTGHDMDLEWQAIAGALGYTSTIVQQTDLDTTAFYSTTDVLIVASGIIDLPSPRVANIQGFLQQGGSVYLQGEYLDTFHTNQAFVSIVAALGGSFGWTGPATGDQQPVNVSGTLATTPNVVAPLGYFWYGYHGSGDATITPFLDSIGGDLGWIFDSPQSGPGLLVHTTDQDWVRATTSPELCENILTMLCAGGGPGTIGQNFECPNTVPNSTGQPGVIAAMGSTAVASNNVILTVDDLPMNQFGYFLNSPLQNLQGFMPPGSQGRLCVGPQSIGRYNRPGEIYNSGPGGMGGLQLNLTDTPIPVPPFTAAVQPGETWYFTSWYRDSNPGSTSNFTDAVCITFQ